MTPTQLIKGLAWRTSAGLTIGGAGVDVYTLDANNVRLVVTYNGAPLVGRGKKIYWRDMAIAAYQALPFDAFNDIIWLKAAAAECGYDFFGKGEQE